MIVKNGEIFGISIKKNTNRQSKIIVKNGEITGLIAFSKTPISGPSGYVNKILGLTSTTVNKVINVASTSISKIIGA